MKTERVALFVDFVLLKPGQDILATQGRWARPKDVNYFAEIKGKKMQIASTEWDDKQVDLVKLYNSIYALN